MDVMTVFAWVIIGTMVAIYALQKLIGAHPDVSDTEKKHLCVGMGTVLFILCMSYVYLHAFDPISAVVNLTKIAFADGGLVLLSEETKEGRAGGGERLSAQGQRAVRGGHPIKRGYEPEAVQIYVWPDRLDRLSAWEGDAFVCEIQRWFQSPLTYYTIRWYDRYPDSYTHEHKGMVPYLLHRSAPADGA